MEKQDRRRIEQVHEHLASTAERPVDRTASRWIGEAEAVAADLVGAEVEASVVAERLGHVTELLENVEDAGDPAANDHVEAASELARDVLER